MTPDQFRASIIISSYNQKEYMVEALESVMRQTFPPFEIIIADDGSSDGSQEVILSFARRYPDWIRYNFQKNNVGIPKNRNSALSIVRGSHVGILDGDDTFIPEKLERQFEALRRVPGAKAVYGNFYRVGPDGRTVLSERYSSLQPEGDILAEVARAHFGILRTLVVDYEMVKASGFMDERFPKFDGFWLTIKLAACCRFAYVNSALVYKRIHPANDSAISSSESLLDDLIGIHRDMQPYISVLGESAVDDLNAHWKTVLASFA